MIGTIKVRGAKEIVGEFRTISRRIDRVTLDTLKEAAEIGRDAIARLAPRAKGRLAKSIAVEKEGSHSVKIIPKGTYYYAASHEFGGTHTPKRSRLMAWKGPGGWVFARRVRIPARPYFYPGFDSVEGRILEKIENDVMNWIGRNG